MGIPGIDKKKISELYENDYDIFLPVLRAYADEIPAVLKKLRTVSAETLQNYASVLHGVKGTSASSCAEKAREKAAELETLAKAGDLSGVLARNGAFLKYMDNLVDGIQNWLLKRGA